ncbi:hypothetical protein MBLNU13_g05304t2 [Cladosporium sp. NU13]
MSGYLFVTAPEADYKAVNLLLHELSNWGYNDGESDFKVITTKNAYDFERPAGSYRLEVTLPDLDSTFSNAWAGSSLKDVEDFCLDVLRAADSGADAPSLFVVVDAAGFEGRNAIVVERAIDDEDEDFKQIDSFVKMRVPWDEVNSVWCNLHIANMSFDEFGELREDRADDGGEGERVDGESVEDAEDWDDSIGRNYELYLCESPNDHKETPLRYAECSRTYFQQHFPGCTIDQSHDTPLNPFAIGLGLLDICRQLYNEAALKPFSQISFATLARCDDSYSGIQRFVDALIPTQARAIARLRITLHDGPPHPLYPNQNFLIGPIPSKTPMAKLKSLTHLEIVLAPIFEE